MQGYLLRPAIEQRHTEQQQLEAMFDTDQHIQPPLMAAIGGTAAHDTVKAELLPQQERNELSKKSSAA
jgi:hypothetical protein